MALSLSSTFFRNVLRAASNVGRPHSMAPKKQKWRKLDLPMTWTKYESPTDEGTLDPSSPECSKCEGRCNCESIAASLKSTNSLDTLNVRETDRSTSSEFPSLGGGQLAQQNTPSQAIWGTTTNLRGAGNAQATIQRPLGPGSAPGSASLGAQQQLQGPEDGFVFGGQGGIGQLAGLSQTQSGE